MKTKRYRLGFSRTFPTAHPKSGEPTFFPEMILSALGKTELLTSTCFQKPLKKIHTCRGNYEHWAKIMSEVSEGKAVIDLFYWENKPYRSKQVVFATLDKDSGCGIQEIDSFVWQYAMIKQKNGITITTDIEELAKNDGLSIEDFVAWLKGSNLSEPLTIIHFTKFRY